MKDFFLNLNIFLKLEEVFQRFPLAFLSVLSLTAIAFGLISEIIEPEYFTGKIANILVISFFAFFSISIYCETNGKPRSLAILLSLLTVFLTSYIVFSQDFVSMNIILYFLGILLSTTYAPVIFSKYDDKIQCNFNASLISNIYFTLMGLIVLSAGLSLILFSLEYLFKLPISDKAYGYIISFGALFFAPILFLSNIPKDIKNIQDFVYPKGLSFNLEYILAPLLVVYLVILYVYGLKILIDFELPRGKVAYLVTTFGFVGIFTHTMLQPFEGSGNIFLRIIRKYFFHLLIVPLILLVIATNERIGDYGITENRYILILIIIWFSVSSLYVIFKKNHSLRIVNITLSALLIASAISPWNANKISGKSQIERFEKLLIQEEILVDGKIQKLSNENETSYLVKKEIESTVRYLVKNNHLSKIRNWFDEDVEFPKMKKRNKIFGSYYNNYEVQQKILQEIGISGYYGGNKSRQTQDGKINYPKTYYHTSDAMNFSDYFGDISKYDEAIYMKDLYFSNNSRYRSSYDLNSEGIINQVIVDVELSEDHSTFIIIDSDGNQIEFDIQEMIFKAQHNTVVNKVAASKNDEFLNASARSGDLEAALFISKFEASIERQAFSKEDHYDEKNNLGTLKLRHISMVLLISKVKAEEENPLKKRLIYQEKGEIPTNIEEFLYKGDQSLILQRISYQGKISEVIDINKIDLSEEKKFDKEYRYKSQKLRVSIKDNDYKLNVGLPSGVELSFDVSQMIANDIYPEERAGWRTASSIKRLYSFQKKGGVAATLDLYEVQAKVDQSGKPSEIRKISAILSIAD